MLQTDEMQYLRNKKFNWKFDTRFEGNELVVKEELIKEDENKPSDENLVNLLREIGNSIDEEIKLTTDCPSQW